MFYGTGSTIKNKHHLSPTGYNKATLTIKKATTDFFKLFDECIKLEEEIKYKPQKEHSKHSIEILSGATILSSALLLAFSFLLLDHLHPRRSYYDGTPEVYFRFNHLDRFAALLIVIAMGLFMFRKPTIRDIETSLGHFIKQLEDVGSDSKNLIFENIISADKIIYDLNKSLKQIKAAKGSIDEVDGILIKKLRPRIGEIIQHLKTQDEEGYFSNNLTTQELNARNDGKLYVNNKPSVASCK